MLWLWLVACEPEPTPGEPSIPDPIPGPMDDVLRPHHLQARGTHNSYHLRTEPVLHPSWAYDHRPLTEQLDGGVRALELDIHHTEAGDFEVFHLPAVDAGTTCLKLTDCFAEIVAWSTAHRQHAPLMVWLEPKDDLDAAAAGYTPLAGHLLDLDAAVAAAVPSELLFTPDELRGDADDLPTAIAAEGGWPTLRHTRGRVIVGLLDGGAHRDELVADNPTLSGRAVFAGAETVDEPWSALHKWNSAKDERMPSGLEAGHLITNNVDSADTSDADNADAAATALAAGAAWIASDFPFPVEGRDYVFTFPEGPGPRCNPVTAPPGCTTDAVESF